MNKTKLFLILCILLSFLSLRFYFFYQHQSQFIDGQEVNFQTTILSEPKSSGNYIVYTAKITPFNNVFITVPRFTAVNYGQKVNVIGTLKVKVLNNKSIIMSMYLPKIEALKNKQNFLLEIMSNIREKIIFLFEQTLPSNLSSLLLGIVFGIKKDMSIDFYNNLKQVGVMHVIAASGMNVTMTAGFFISFFGLFLKRKQAIVVSVLGILFYAILSGLQASIVRASIMGIMLFVAQFFGRQYLAAYGLFLTALLMLFYNPATLFDIGFQLSFLSTLGILTLQPLLSFKKFENIISDDVKTTTCAQIATLPIMLVNFGQYGMLSILVNGLVLWTIPILMILGASGTIVGFIFAPLAKIFLLLSLPFLIFFETVVNFFGSLKWNIQLQNLPISLILGYYLLIISVVIFVKKRN